MILEIIKQFNWVDIFVIILSVRVLYIAVKNGLPVELFKLLGTIAAIYLSLHYYTILSDWIAGLLPEAKDKMPLEFIDFLAFAILAIVAYLIFVLLRSLIYRFIKMEAVPRLNKWGGFILGIARAYLLVGLVIFMLAISSVAYFKSSVKKSYAGGHLFKVAPGIYNGVWNSLMSKFMNKEKFNKTIPEVEEDFEKAEAKK
jgi:membrane protein required for colicin V production